MPRFLVAFFHLMEIWLPHAQLIALQEYGIPTMEFQFTQYTEVVL